MYRRQKKPRRGVAKRVNPVSLRHDAGRASGPRLFSTTFVIHSLRCDSHNVVTATLARTCAPRGFVQLRCLFLVSSSLSSAASRRWSHTPLLSSPMRFLKKFTP